MKKDNERNAKIRSVLRTDSRKAYSRVNRTVIEKSKSPISRAIAQKYGSIESISSASFLGKAIPKTTEAPAAQLIEDLKKIYQVILEIEKQDSKVFKDCLKARMACSDVEIQAKNISERLNKLAEEKNNLSTNCSTLSQKVGNYQRLANEIKFDYENKIQLLKGEQTETLQNQKKLKDILNYMHSELSGALSSHSGSLPPKLKKLATLLNSIADFAKYSPSSSPVEVSQYIENIKSAIQKVKEELNKTPDLQIASRSEKAVLELQFLRIALNAIERSNEIDLSKIPNEKDRKLLYGILNQKIEKQRKPLNENLREDNEALRHELELSQNIKREYENEIRLLKVENEQFQDILAAKAQKSDEIIPKKSLELIEDLKNQIRSLQKENESLQNKLGLINNFSISKTVIEEQLPLLPLSQSHPELQQLVEELEKTKDNLKASEARSARARAELMVLPSRILAELDYFTGQFGKETKDSLQVLNEKIQLIQNKILDLQTIKSNRSVTNDENDTLQKENRELISKLSLLKSEMFKNHTEHQKEIKDFQQRIVELQREKDYTDSNNEIEFKKRIMDLEKAITLKQEVINTHHEKIAAIERAQKKRLEQIYLIKTGFAALKITLTNVNLLQKNIKEKLSIFYKNAKEEILRRFSSQTHSMELIIKHQQSELDYISTAAIKQDEAYQNIKESQEMLATNLDKMQININMKAIQKSKESLLDTESLLLLKEKQISEMSENLLFEKTQNINILKKVEELKNEILFLSTKIEEFKGLNLNLHTEIETLKQKHDKELTETNEILQSEKAKTNLHQREVEQLNNKILSLTKRIEENTEINNKLNTELDIIKQENYLESSEMSKIIKSEKDINSNYEKEIKQLNDKILFLSKTIEECTKNNQNLKPLPLDPNIQFPELHEVLPPENSNTYQKEIEELSNKILILTKQNEEMTELNHTLDAELNSIKKEANISENNKIVQCNKYQEEIEKLNKTILSNSQIIDEYTEHNQNLLIELSSLKEEYVKKITELNTIIKSEKDSNIRFQEEVQQLNDKISSLSKIIEEYFEQNQNMRTELDLLKQEHIKQFCEMKEILRSDSENKEKYQEEIKQLNIKISFLIVENEEYNELNKNLTAELEAIKQEHSEGKPNIEISLEKEKNARYEKEIDQLKNKIATITSTIEEFSELNHKLQNEIDLLKQEPMKEVSKLEQALQKVNNFVFKQNVEEATRYQYLQKSIEQCITLKQYIRSGLEILKTRRIESLTFQYY